MDELRGKQYMSIRALKNHKYYHLEQQYRRLLDADRYELDRMVKEEQMTPFEALQEVMKWRRSPIVNIKFIDHLEDME